MPDDTSKYNKQHVQSLSSDSQDKSQQFANQMNEINTNERNSTPSTPNIFLENLVDNDYFSRSRQSSEQDKDNQIENNLFDDDDGIDDDLTAGTTNFEEDGNFKHVLIKYYNDSNVLTANDSIYVIGSFNGWSKKIKLEPQFDSVGNVEFFKTLISLTLGVYRLKFLVNNEIKYSENLPIATDKSGNFVNWFEVDIKNSNETVEAGTIESSKIYNNKKKSSVSFFNNESQSSSMIIKNPHENLITPQPIEKLTYSQYIPDPFKSLISNDDDDEILPIDETFLHRNPIPDLPVYLNNNYLNKHFNTHHTNNSSSDGLDSLPKSSMKGLNSHILPHVNLNHLLTSNIKNNVLAVACTTRYSGKFLTQIMYSPSEIDL